MELVREEAKAAPQTGAERTRGPPSKPHLSARGRDERGEQADERGLAGPVRTHESHDVAGAYCQRQARDRASATEMSGSVEEADRVEVDSHAARPARSAGSGPVSSPSRAL